MAFEPKIVGTLGQAPQPKVVGMLDAMPDITAIDTRQMPADVRGDADRMRNAYVYARNLGISTDEAYDYEPQINGILYGEGTTSSSAWNLTRNKMAGVRRKSIGQAAADATGNNRLRTTKWLAGLGRQFAEIKGLEASLIDPAFRWMFGIPKDVDLDKLLIDISEAAAADLKQGQQDHPEMGFAIDPDAGYAETLRQAVTRPENLVQGLAEAVPMILEGTLGTIVAGPVGGIAAMALPISGEVYQDARAEGTDILPAFAQAIATGGIEAAIEQWTLGRKIGLGKNITRMLTERPGRKLLWEGTKAFFRGTAEEGSQQLNANFWQWVFTDRSQKWFDGVQQAAALGGPLEMIMSGGFAGAGKVGSPVNPDEANRRLDVLRRMVNESGLSVTDKDELLAELDKAPQLVPEIFGIEEDADGTAAEQAGTSEPAAQTPGAGEGAADLAARMPEAAAESGPAQTFWQRLNDPAGFTAADEAEADLKEAFDAGILEKPEDVAEWMKPGTTPPAINDPAVRAPSARTTSARQADLLDFLHEIGRQSKNSHERQAWSEAMQSKRAQDAMNRPDLYIDKVMQQGELLHSEEEAGLTMHLAKLRNEKESVLADITRLEEGQDDGGLFAEMDRVEAQMERVINALDVGGSDIGRALNIRKLLLNEKLEIEHVKRRARKKKGSPLTEQDNARFEKMVAEHARMTDEINTLRAQLDAARAEKAAKRSGKRRKAQPKPTRDQRLAKNMAKLKELMEAGC